MTPIEFKSWFEGFTESLDGPPTKKQWDRIKTRISEMKAPVPNYYYPYHQNGYNVMGQAQNTTVFPMNTGMATSAYTLGKTEASNG